MIETEAQRTRTGMLYALATFGAWGLNPFYFKAVDQFPAIEVLAHRVVWSSLLLAALISWGRQWPRVAAAVTARRTLATLALTSLIIGGNWMIYIHAMDSDQVLEASLGYYINPLVNILFGRVFLGERLSRTQMLAVALAAIGVLNLAVAFGEPPWLALGLAGTFATYGLMRKLARVEALPGLFIEALFLLPIALGLLLVLGTRFGRIDPTTDLLLVAAGPVTALPLLWFTHAARRLKLSVLGFFQYLSPSCQFLLAVFAFGEHFGPAHYVTFACIWTAIAIFTFAPRLAR
ncbi:MAG TPA: EamA family transporter RarD [Dongiaceae bacterium]|jgi:chloramphenicol-sensitive protein RarD|nr:EamA family transporter RarD [Dongiaceae bacterium]